MKKTEKIFVSITSLEILLNNVAYASTEVAEKQDGLSMKYIFIGVAVLIIILLLYLGYKMDTKGNERSTKVSHKSEKVKKKLTEKAEEIQQNSGAYEADDNITYEADKDMFENEDLNEKIEYDEDEDSLFATTFENNDSIFEDDPIEINDIPEEKTEVEEEFINEEPEEEVEEEPEEELGEEFDTSVIDGLDDEEDEEETEPKKSFDETMIFTNEDFAKDSSGNDLEEEIDNLDNLEEMEALKEEENRDSFIEELKNFKEPESDFEGFSSASNIKSTEEEPEVKPHRKYTKVKKENTSVDNDFLSQMEENLQKSKAERNAKKESSKEVKKTSRKKEN